MAQNPLTCDREQWLLLPPDLRDWLDEDHLGWFVIGAIDELDLEPFYASYRSDGHGAAAHDPKMMLTLFAYAYCVGERSSRGIERRCREDVACRVITANQAPDHATIARFRVSHEEALADLFSPVLGLCAEAGLVKAGVVAVDGSKFAASASDSAIRTYEEIAAEVLAEATRIDAAEEAIHGDERGDELLEHLSTRGGRRAWLREAKRRLRGERAEKIAAGIAAIALVALNLRPQRHKARTNPCPRQLAVPASSWPGPALAARTNAGATPATPTASPASKGSGRCRPSRQRTGGCPWASGRPPGPVRA